MSRKIIKLLPTTGTLITILKILDVSLEALRLLKSHYKNAVSL